MYRVSTVTLKCGIYDDFLNCHAFGVMASPSKKASGRFITGNDVCEMFVEEETLLKGWIMKQRAI